MTRREYKLLQAYAKIAKELNDQVSDLDRLTRAVRYRAADKKVPFLQIGVSVPMAVRNKYGGTYDAGCYVNVPIALVRDGILPVLREALKKSKSELAALPPAAITDSDAFMAEARAAERS